MLAMTHSFDTPQTSEPSHCTRAISHTHTCLTYEWVMSDIWMSHVTHLNVWRHTHEYVMLLLHTQCLMHMVCLWCTHTIRMPTHSYVWHHACVCLCVCVYVCMYMYVYTIVYAFPCIYVYIYIYIYIYWYVWHHTFIYVAWCTLQQDSYIYTYVFTYTYTMPLMHTIRMLTHSYV